MSELIEFIPLVQSSEVENDVDNEQKNDLVSDLQEANDILAYFKKEYGNTEPERYQKLLKEHEDLRVTTIDAVKSENKITVSELESIKKEFEDIKEIESYGEWMNRQRLETAKSLANSAFEFFKDGNYDHTKVLSQIESSDISNSNKNKVNAILGDAHHILVMSKNTKNYDEFKSQYIVIEGIISTALNTSNDLNIHDINGVQDAYSSLLTINELYHIEKNFEEKSGKNYNKYTEKISKQRQERNEIRLRSIDISNEGDYSEEDAKNILYILNKNYSEYSEGITEGTNEDSLLELNGKNKEDIKSFQLRLLEKIIGNDGGFGNGYIVGYTNVSGYYLANEDIITQDISHKDYDISHETTLNYLNYLYETKSNNKDIFMYQLIQNFGKEKAKDLLSIWSKKNESSGIIDDTLIAAFEVINYLTDEEKIKEDFQKNINNITDPIIKKYILTEISDLECGKADDWTTLLHSYVMNSEFGMTTNDEDFWDKGKRSAHNTAQDSMISNILGGQENFNDEFVKGYKSELGNYLIKIDDFKNLLQSTNVEEWNSLAFANYIRSFNGNLSSADLLELVGYENVLQLSKLWNKNGEKQGGNIAKEILEKNNPRIVEDVKLVQETFTSVENVISSDLTVDQKEIAQSYLESNTEAQSKFKNLLLEKFQTNNVDNPEKLANEIIKNILTSRPNDIFKIFIEIEEKYSVKLLNKESIDITTKAIEENLINKTLQYKIEDNIEKQKETTSLFKEMKIISTYTNNSSEDKIRLALKKIRDNDITFEEILNEERKNNYELDQQLTLIEHKYNNIDEQLNKQIQVEIDKNIEEIESNDNKVQNSISYQNFSLDKDTENPTIETLGGKKIPIDKEEALMVEKNPDAMENIVKMYEFFTELNLQSVWELRTELSLAMGVTNINLQDDGLKESELIAYGNKLLHVMNNLNPKANSLNTNNNTLSSLKANFNEYTGTKSILSANKTHGSEGEDKFKYDLRMCGLYNQNHGIQISEFRNKTKK